MKSTLGWQALTNRPPNPRSIANFPMQANGAAIMQVAACMLTESGIDICCPVHDSFLIQALIEQIDEVTTKTKNIMEEASRVILKGNTVRTDATTIKYPDRYADDRGGGMWERALGLLSKVELAEIPF